MTNENDFDIPGKIETDVVGAFNDYNLFLSTLKKIPLPTLQEHKLIGSYDDHEGIARLYNHRLKNSGQLFRKNRSADEQLVLIWQSKVILEATQQFIIKGLQPFKGVSETSLRELAKLSVDVNSILALPSILAKLGVYLIYQPSLQGMKLDGSVAVLASGNPVIALSFRFSRVDHFWFTLMHELAHVCLHYDKLENPILDSLDDSESQAEDIEIQANRLSKYSLVDKVSWRNCKPKYTKDEGDVRQYAQQLGIHPAIVAGLLQNEFRDFTRFRTIVDETDVRKLVFGA